VSGFLKLGFEVFEVENLAVISYADGPVLVIERLPAFFRQVYNFEAFVADGDAVGDVKTLLLGASMVE
jgi:hypothetical protein